MKTILRIALICFAVSTFADEKPSILAGNQKFMYGVLKNVVLGSAQRMPEEHFAFKPAESVRTYGQILGHIADAQYGFCATVLGEKPPRPQVEKNASSKADLIAALKDAFTYCDKAYGSVTDANAAEMVKLMGMDMPRLGVLTTNGFHTMEHYGNLVTYMRMKNVVPPTSDPGFMQNVTK
jgi:uncharacterized damage-inducible protein DinB